MSLVIQKSSLSTAEPRVVTTGRGVPRSVGDRRSDFCKIWIDLDNTPHVPFFKPIIAELESLRHNCVLTVRDAFTTADLARHHKLAFRKIGRHHGQNRLLKLTGLLLRSLQLLPFALRERPAIALSHGSRSQIFIARLLRIPSVEITDYEHVAAVPFFVPDWLLMPSVLRDSAAGLPYRKGVCTYTGIKEDVYLPSFVPDPALLPCLGIAPGEIVVTVRPPATEAHYHNPEAETLLTHFLTRASRAANMRAVIIPRNARQAAALKAAWAEPIASRRFILPDHPLDGLNLIWHSDLVVSGGGTMNREAAALGVPVYSIFRGKIGAVDRHLAREGRLRLIESIAQLNEIPLVRRSRLDSTPRGAAALDQITSHIVAILEESAVLKR